MQTTRITRKYNNVQTRSASLVFLVVFNLTLIPRLLAAQTVDPSLTANQLQDAAEMANLSLAVYDLKKTDSKSGLDAGWTQFPNSTRDDLDGFQAAAYERKLANGREEIVVAFAGTKDARDWATDISQGNAAPMGMLDTVFTREKFNKAVDYARQFVELKDKNPNMEILFTGHSLGGAYATVCGLVFGEKATVFNAAAVVKADSMISPSMRQNAKSLVTQFVLEGDYIHDPTGKLPGAKQYGREYRISLPPDLKVGVLPSLFLDHGLEAFQVALDSAYAAKRGSPRSAQTPNSKQLSAFQKAEIREAPEIPQLPFRSVNPEVPDQSMPRRPPSINMPPPPERPRPTPAAYSSFDDGRKQPPSLAAFRNDFSHAVSDSVGSGLGYQSPRIGGVMLQGAADMTDSNSQLTAGNFSLIFQGGDGGIAIPTLRRFVTALWATYFTTNGPGISIDPIEGFTNRHAVRYIGRVVNSDLGRVMREADYQMKSWAVGSGRPDVTNWLTPEEFGVRNGVLHSSPSRFWFVPEKMRFREAGDVLLFDSGQMTVKTEYLFGKTGQRSEENEEWAEQFTKRYNELAQKYSIYDDLFEYAKLVSLAKYLKEHKIPLLWFLLANRDMVITEDSPGTVKAFVKKSDYFEDCTIAGGVDFSPTSSSDSYVADQDLLDAVAAANKNTPPTMDGGTAPEEIIEGTNKSLTVVLSETVVVSDSHSAGDDFATDLGLRLNGTPNLEIARFRRFDPLHGDTFGNQWHLMIPFHVSPGSEKRIAFQDFQVPETMVLDNLITGRRETLLFDTNRYEIAGYVPADPDHDINIGLFFMNDGTLRLADKLGCNFQFDGEGRMTDMVLAPDYQISYEYNKKTISWQEYDAAPFLLSPTGSKEVTFQNVSFPKEMSLFDSTTGKTEIFNFDETNSFGIVGYSPINPNSSSYSFLSILSDGSFLMQSKTGSQIAFDSSGQFDHLVVDVVKRIIQKPYEVQLDYDADHGQYRITSAHVLNSQTNHKEYVVTYKYTREGNLAGASVASLQ